MGSKHFSCAQKWLLVSGLLFIFSVLVHPPAFSAACWLDHFEGTPGVQPSGWEDETNNADFNAEIAYATANSLATISRTSDDTWGKVLSQNHTVDVSLYPMLGIHIAGLSGAVSWRVGIQETEGSWQHWFLQDSSIDTGTFTYDIAAVTGWIGVHNFKVEIIVEGAGGEAIEVDYVEIYGAGPSPTATGTPTPIPTNTFTDTPTPTPTIEGVAWLEGFDGAPGLQPAGWEDETDDNGFNAEIAYAATASRAVVSRTGEDTWGKVLSPGQNVDVSAYPYLEINIAALSAAVSWKLGIQETEGSWQHWTLQESSLSTGTFVYDLGAATGWGGTHNFKVEIIVEGAAGENIELEYLQIISMPPTPTPTPSPVYTDTHTPSLTPTEIIRLGWQEHFDGVSGQQPAGWEDETDDSGFNAEIAYAATASWAVVSRNNDDTWGKVLSPGQNLDVTVYPYLKIYIPALSAAVSWKLGIQETEGSWQHWTLQDSSIDTGTFTYDIAAVTGWSGTRNFKIEIIVEGASGENISVDNLEVYGIGPEPTATATLTDTPTPIPTNTYTDT
ncbi:hypothetical protein JW933_07745, partial [candidate division FCPU426 bacterium]|nr:hypothetical protein [candidate division FCPU426 bacterium]